MTIDIDEEASRPPSTASSGASSSDLNRTIDIVESGPLTRPNVAQLMRIFDPASSKSSRQLVRASSQVGAGGVVKKLPLKFPRSQRQLSFPSTAVQSVSTLELKVQNGSDEILPLNTRVTGGNFTIKHQQMGRMCAQEVRSFDIQFRPTQVGAHRAEITFELATSAGVSKTVPIFGYGGLAAIKVEGWQPAPVGPYFVTMGTVENVNLPLMQG